MPPGTPTRSTATSGVSPQAAATAFTSTGPTSGVINTAAANFPVTPNAYYTGTIAKITIQKP